MKVLKLLLPTLAGLLAGVAGALLVREPTPEESEAPRVEFVFGEGERATLQPSFDPRPANLDAGPDNPAAESPGRAQETTTLSLEEHLARREEERVNREATARAELQEHYQATPDPAWARQAQYDLWSALEQEAVEHGGQVDTVDCRRETCVVATRWSSFEEAYADAPKMLHVPFSPNCPRRLQLFEPDDPAAPYLAEMFIDCTGEETRGY